MKTFVFVIAMMGLSLMQAQAQKEISSEISDVVVYLKGAQVTRTANVSVGPGKSILLFKGLTPRLNSNSLQVSTGTGITILSVNHSIDYLDSPKSDELAKKLVNRRDELQDSISLNKNTRLIYIKEQEMLISNQSIGGQQTGVNVEQLIRATDFFRQRLTEIEKNLFDNNRTTLEMQRRLDKINRQLNELNAQDDQPTSTIKIAVSTNRTVQAPVELTYTVRDARWQPFYDIRVEDTDAPITLVYKAKVFQSTNENWDNVKLTLSTGNPTISNYKPELQPWFLYPAPVQMPKVMKGINIVEDDVELYEEMVIEDKEEEARPIRIRGMSSLGKQNVTTIQQQTTTAFEIQIPYTIPSDNQGYDVAVSDHQVKADFQYATVPKRSPHVYLMAHIADWNELNLLPGQANIYFDQTYQGKTILNPFSSEDTLNLSVGRDPGIIVERELQKDFSSKSLFGNNAKETKAWKITVRNSKNTKASVLVEDQYPVSTNSDIKVELEESNGAKVNPQTGLLIWDLILAPGETKELRFIYTVRYPKEMDLIIE
ncbi:DUF4139 domain-containing protein [Marinilabilia salmonicolor]|uniref:DUF4139 domain-containing protein n=1 Tax=Marinilabilia salmonicolor TaxID=989 RepID=UPI00029AF4C0|nr:DUF4139 domain-containing protein [Marinilabilia salmonicolor]